MSWFGDGFTQLKGQLSTLAKVLVEDADSVPEGSTESPALENSSPANQEYEPETENRGSEGAALASTSKRTRHASEGWTDVQLTCPESSTDGVTEEAQKIEAFQELEQPSASTTPVKSNSEKDVGAIIRVGIANLFQKGKDHLDSSSSSKGVTWRDQYSQTDSIRDNDAVNTESPQNIIFNMQQTIATLTRQNESLRSEVSRLEAAAVELEAQAGASQDENANLSTGMEELDIQHQRAIESLMEVKDEALKDYESLKVRYSVLAEEVEEMNRDKERRLDLTKELEERDRELECLEAENASLREVIQQLSDEAERGREKLPTVMEEEEDDEHQPEVEELKIRVKDLESELIRLRGSNNIEISEKESQSADKKTENLVELSKTDISKDKDEFELLKLRVQDLEEECNIKGKSILKLEDEVSRLKEAAVLLNEQMKQAEETCEGLEWEKEEMYAELDRIKGREQEAIRSAELLTELQCKLDEAIASKEFLKRESESKDRRMCQILLEANATEQDLQNSLQDERKVHDEKVMKLESDLKLVQNEVISLKDELNRYNSPDEENGRLLETIKQLNQEKIALNENILELDMKLATVVEKMSNLESVNTDLTDKHMKHNDLIRSKDDEISASKSALDKLQDQLKQSECDFTRELEKFRALTEQYRIEHEVSERMETEMKGRLQAKEDEISALKQFGSIDHKSEQLSLLQQEKDEAIKKSDVLQLEIKTLNERLTNERNNELKELSDKVSNLIKEKEKVCEENSVLKNEINALLSQRVSEEQYEKERINFLKKIESITEQNVQLLADVVRLNSEHSKEKTCLIAAHSFEITSLKDQFTELERKHADLENSTSIMISKLKDDLTAVENERTELLRSIQMKHNECISYQTEVMRLNEVLKEEKARFEKILVEKSQMELKCEQLKKYEERLNSYQEKEASDNKKIASLTQECQNLRDQLGYASELLKETKRQEAEGRCDSPPAVLCPNGCAQTKEELDKLTWSLHSEQANSKTLQLQVADYKDKLEKAGWQLTRLQNHLVELEKSHTEELIKSQNSMAELKSRLDAAEELARSSSTAYTSANIRANQQVECLSVQIKSLTELKEKLEVQLSLAEDSSLKQQAAVTNLQAVLHQFKLDKQRDIEFETERIQQKLNESLKRNDSLSAEIQQLKDQLSDTKKGLMAASRLSEQLDQKSHIIATLQNEVAAVKENLKKEEEKVNAINSTVEGRIDRNLVRNLLVGYVCAPDNSKNQVLRVLGSVLDFSKEERTKVGLEESTTAQQQTLSQAFIKFLESESQPKPHLILSVPLMEGPSRKTSQSSLNSGIINPPPTSSILLPPDGLGSSLLRSGSILKDVLKEPSQHS